MAPELSELDRAKKGVAALVACVVQALNETDPSFQARFLDKLSSAYREFRDHPADGDGLHDLELLSWTREMVTGFSLATGQGKPFPED
jgi:hypothetical protein